MGGENSITATGDYWITDDSACFVPATVRPAAHGGAGKARKWVSDWLSAGAYGVALPAPYAALRAARVRGGGIAVYDSANGYVFIWLGEPEWWMEEYVQPLEPTWYRAAVRALQEAA